MDGFAISTDVPEKWMKDLFLTTLPAYFTAQDLPASFLESHCPPLFELNLILY